VLHGEEKEGVVTEDDAKRGKEQIDELTKTYEHKIEELVEKKKKEVLDV
jgi:ribosome recycling factor